MTSPLVPGAMGFATSGISNALTLPLLMSARRSAGSFEILTRFLASHAPTCAPGSSLPLPRYGVLRYCRIAVEAMVSMRMLSINGFRC